LPLSIFDLICHRFSSNFDGNHTQKIYFQVTIEKEHQVYLTIIFCFIKILQKFKIMKKALWSIFALVFIASSLFLFSCKKDDPITGGSFSGFKYGNRTYPISKAYFFSHDPGQGALILTSNTISLSPNGEFTGIGHVITYDCTLDSLIVGRGLVPGTYTMLDSNCQGPCLMSLDEMYFAINKDVKTLIDNSDWTSIAHQNLNKYKTVVIKKRGNNYSFSFSGITAQDQNGSMILTSGNFEVPLIVNP
jgi:hypothetical protein